MAKLLSGEATLEGSGASRVIKIPGSTAPGARGTAAGKARWVWYPVEREESIFTILTEFGDKKMSASGGTAGPRKNQIPKPDRNWDGNSTDDNATYWVPDFNTAHFKKMMFGETNSFKDFYLKQSNGRFLAKGDVSPWARVPYNEARYGSNEISEADGYWNFIKDSLDSWYMNQKSMGKTDAQVKSYLKAFDKVDRYDYDGDGVYMEPDGYIDHFQDIHAGEGEEAGGGAQGEDAIWSHRWYAFSDGIGSTGPANFKGGGVQIGNSGIWVGDYTTEPENGGLGVFTHEFGHDLGLADYYDTAGGDNSTAFWTLMSSGSWLNTGGDSIGTKPGYMGPHEKMLLGWLDYALVKYGQNRNVRVGPADQDGYQMPQALAVTLPKKPKVVSYNKPYSGSYEWWGGSADNVQNTLARPIDLTGKTNASVSAMLWADIEEDYDYLYGEVSTNGGSTWTQVGTPITGQDPAWVSTSWSLSAYSGKKIMFRWRYATDGGVHYGGPFLDNIKVMAGSTTLLSDDVEAGDNGWVADGFSRMGGTTTEMVSHYYLAENRVYSNYDKTLATGPYNFGWADTKPNWVERFRYQNGLVVWYQDGAFDDNNTSVHPGGGFSLPVDARPAPIVASNGGVVSNRRGAFDAAFGQEATEPVTFHKNGVAVRVKASPAMPTFDDSMKTRYWNKDNPWASTAVAGSGTMITVDRTASQGWVMDLKVRFK